MKGITVRHSSPSVASNYAVRINSGSLRMENCDVSSSTGSGVGTEGGSVQIVSCSITSSKRHGVAIFPGLSPTETDSSVRDSIIRGNGLSGLYIRGDGQEVEVVTSDIVSNSAWGINAAGGGIAKISGCSRIERNGKGKYKEEADGIIRINTHTQSCNYR
mmetsp:Transcript_300/g.798  ORF Transcript_300/g.798 Transcript_300/m.798 type:complete len:160 (+) Transcript_300:287-766(+)